MRELNRYRYCAHSVIMGNMACNWQNKDYVLSYFGLTALEGRQKYYSYVKEGIEQGRRPELVEGGLIRTLGGWAVRELGVEGTQVAKKSQMSQPGVAYAVRRGKRIVKAKGIQMIE